MAGSSGTAYPGFPCFVFGGGFLAECRYLRGNGHGCPFQSDAAWMPLEDDRSLRHTFSFCLETSSRKKRTENRDRQFRCCRPLKKLTHGRPPPNITCGLSCYVEQAENPRLISVPNGNKMLTMFLEYNKIGDVKAYIKNGEPHIRKGIRERTGKWNC